MVLSLPCVILCSNEDYLVFYCLFQIRFYPFFIHNCRGETIRFIQTNCFIESKLFLCSIAICMELVLRLVSLHSSLFGILPLWLDHEGRRILSTLSTLSVWHSVYIKPMCRKIDVIYHGLSGHYRFLEHWWCHPIPLLDLY